MSLAWVALGGNVGDPRATLLRALRWLSALPGCTLERASSLHRTVAVGPAQPDFLNAVARLRTRLVPRELLGALLVLERAAGRERTIPWGPRTLDLDLLAMGDRGELCRTLPDLELPHPRMAERRFVLAPLAEIDPDLVLAGGMTVRARLALLDATPT